MIKRKQKKCAIKECENKTFGRLCSTHEKKRLMEKAAKKKSKAKKDKKRKPIAKYPKTTLLKKHTFDILSLYVRLRDSNEKGMCKCITCDKVGYFYNDCIQDGHFIGRQHLSTAFLAKNNNAQCEGCNKFGAGEQYLHGLAIDVKWGEGTANMLLNLKQVAAKHSPQDYVEMIRKYTRDAEELLKYKKFHKEFKDKIQDRLNFYKRFVNRIIIKEENEQG